MCFFSTVHTLLTSRPGCRHHTPCTSWLSASITDHKDPRGSPEGLYKKAPAASVHWEAPAPPSPLLTPSDDRLIPSCFLQHPLLSGHCQLKDGHQLVIISLKEMSGRRIVLVIFLWISELLLWSPSASPGHLLVSCKCVYLLKRKCTIYTYMCSSWVRWSLRLKGDKISTIIMWIFTFNTAAHPVLIDTPATQWEAALRLCRLSDLSRLFGSVSAFILNLGSQECLFHLLSAATFDLWPHYCCCGWLLTSEDHRAGLCARAGTMPQI